MVKYRVCFAGNQDGALMLATLDFDVENDFEMNGNAIEMFRNQCKEKLPDIENLNVISWSRFGKEIQ